MITVRLMGGLGNQMFQYAFIRAKALRSSTTCALDKSFLDIKKTNANYTLRNFELDYFHIHAVTSNVFATKFTFFMDRILRKLKLGSLVQHEKSMRFSPQHKNSKSTFFCGYFQCEKYFQDFEEQIKKDFEPRLEMCKPSQYALEDINKHFATAVSVHIRRGDYVTLAIASEVHGSCTKEYYESAMELIRRTIPNPRFYFFSDDIEWVKKEFNFVENAFFVEDENDKKSFEDMILMSRCHSHIIANSSYSWWGAWLNKNPKKVVIAPLRWFSSSQMEYNDIVPPTWIKI